MGVKDILNTNDRHSHASRRNIMRRNIAAGNCSSLKKPGVLGKKRERRLQVERHFEKLKLWSSTADSLALFDSGPISLVIFHSILWKIRHGIGTIKKKIEI